MNEQCNKCFWQQDSNCLYMGMCTDNSSFEDQKRCKHEGVLEHNSNKGMNKTNIIAKLDRIIDKWEAINCKQRGEWYNDCSSIDDIIEDLEELKSGIKEMTDEQD